MAVTWSSSGIDLHLDVTPSARPAHQLADALRAAIRAGRLRPGAVVPSTRALATDLGLARGTVSSVYADLAAEGYLTIRHGAPTRIAAGLHALPGRSAPPVGAGRPPAPRWDLVPGRPNLSAFPRDAWLAASRRMLDRVPADALGYSNPLGQPALRTALAGYLRRARGVLAEPDQVIVGGGFSHLLAWWGRVLAVRGIDAVAFEDPSLPNLRAIARACGLRVLGVEVDDDGMRVGDIDAPAVVVTPAHQYPLGVTLAPSRRVALAHRAIEAGLFVLEDDYDGEFRFDRRPVGALQPMAPENVIYAGTSSKTLAPALRLAWFVVPRRLVRAFRETAPALGERQPSALEQLTMAELIDSGGYDRQVRRMRTSYRRRRDQVLAATAPFPDLVTPAGIAAGLHLLLRVPHDGPDDGQVLRAARRHSLGVATLSENWIEARERPRGVIVGYATPADHAFGPAVDALVAMLAELAS